MVGHAVALRMRRRQRAVCVELLITGIRVQSRFQEGRSSLMIGQGKQHATL